MAVKIPSKLGSMSPTFQKAWYKRNKMPLPTHLTGSVKQASKEVKPSERVKRLQAKSIQAYGATRGTKVGGEHGSEDMRDTIKPLTRDQHSKIQAAERAAKAAAKAAAPKTPKVKKPLTQDERMAAIRRAFAKAKAKDRFDVPTMDPDDADHDDLRDVHQSLHVRRGYNEEVESVEESVATAQKVMDRAKVVANTNPDPKKRFAASGLAQKAMLRTINPTGVNTGITRGGGNKTYRMITGKVPPYQLTKKTGVSEEVEQIGESIDWDKKVKLHRRDAKNPNNTLRQRKHAESMASRALEASKITDPERAYRHYMGVPQRSEQVNEGKMKDIVTDREETARLKAQDVLGGPVKTRTGMEPKGKLPLGYRRARSLAGQAAKAGKSVTESMSAEETKMNRGKLLARAVMAKQSKHPIAQNMGEEVEWVDEKVEIFHRQGPGSDMERYHKDTSNPAAVLARKKAADAARTSRVAGDLKAKKMGQTMSTGNGGAVKAVSTTSQGFKKEEVEQMDEAKLPHLATFVPKEGSKARDHISIPVHNDHGEKSHKAKFQKIFGKDIASQYKLHGVFLRNRLGELDEEVEQIDEQDDSMEKKEMAQTQLHFMAYAAKEILEFIDMGGEIEEWYQNKLSKVQSEVESLHSYIEGEKRRTGMVKEEEEVVTEAEGTVAVTPKEKALAAHHGDKSKITYGDVIKARLKSAAAKKMGK